MMVVTGNVAVVAPAATTTLDGTPTSVVFELRNATIAPPAPAGAESVTRPLVDVPPTILVLVSVTPVSTGAMAGITVNVVALVTPPYDAEIVVDVDIDT